MKHQPVILDAAMRRSVESGVRGTCDKRGWPLLAVNVRTNHAHTVLENSGFDSKRALSSMKANATVRMRLDGCWPFAHSPWSTGGSRRRLWNEESIRRAIDYVLNGQGDDLPDF